MRVLAPRPAVLPAPVADPRAPAKAAAAPDTFATPLKEIALAGPITDPKEQISSMGWHGDQLLLVPEKGGALYALQKNDLLRAAQGAAEPLTPRTLLLGPRTFAARMPGFDGFEAMAVSGDRVFLLAEAKSETASWGYLMFGRLNAHGLTIDLDSVKRLPESSQVKNKGYEALVIAYDRVVALPEARAARHVGQAFTLDLEPLGEVAMPRVDYRLTDSTPADADGRFWVANYNLPGEEGMPDGPHIEQLLPMRLSGDAILSDGPARQIAFDPAQPGRNWEAVERLDDKGLLVMTDMYPGSILGFVPR